MIRDDLIKVFGTNGEPCLVRWSIEFDSSDWFVFEKSGLYQKVRDLIYQAETKDNDFLPPEDKG